MAKTAGNAALIERELIGASRKHADGAYEGRVNALPTKRVNR
jgi:hypothetical protein